VQTQYATRPGEIPRRIQIERKKRLYAEQSLEALLRERGVDTAAAAPSALQAIAPRAASLPLEVFDDEAYEVRSAEAWAAMAAAGGGGLPARALYTLSDSHNSSSNSNGHSSSSNGSNGTTAAAAPAAAAAQWRECLVTGRDPATGLWSLQWLEGTARECAQQLSKPRLAVYLRAEDPFNFADRVAAAHARRAAAERSLLHALCVDCMPGDGLAELDSEAMNRIMGLCMRSRAVDQTLADCSQLMDQVS
jgi:dynein heavy chain, axonemal